MKTPSSVLTQLFTGSKGGNDVSTSPAATDTAPMVPTSGGNERVMSGTEQCAICGKEGCLHSF